MVLYLIECAFSNLCADFLYCFVGLGENIRVQGVKGQKKCEWKKLISFCAFVILFYALIIITLPHRVNGKQSPGKPVRRGQTHPAKSNFHQENAKDNSEVSNPEETMTSKTGEMNSGTDC